MTKTDNRVAIGKRIQELRVEAGFTQQRFAAMVGISRGSYSDIERGERGFSVDVLHRIVRAFGLTYTEFFSGIDGAETMLKNSKR